MSKQKQRGFAFPTSKKLFWRRLFSHWREQSAIIRTAADWTVLLYILIPGGFLGGRLYYGFWNEALPAECRFAVYVDSFIISAPAL